MTVAHLNLRPSPARPCEGIGPRSLEEIESTVVALLCTLPASQSPSMSCRCALEAKMQHDQQWMSKSLGAFMAHVEVGHWGKGGSLQFPPGAAERISAIVTLVVPVLLTVDVRSPCR